ncbi:MAG: exodeoxyribonuclease III [Calditrichaeota bacterium]|nr:exodeoxyribonuclease III [Calditrichota bacterium]
MSVMKLISWNVNGIRAMEKKGIFDWMIKENADMYCFQETKVQEDQLTDDIRHVGDYDSDWFSAERKGYSSVATYSKQKPKAVHKGFDEKYDPEGRVIRHDFDQFTLFNIYFPNGERNEERLQYKLDFYEDILTHFEQLRSEGKKLVICGDYNTAHHEIDIARPKENLNVSGFMPIERAWLDRIESMGYIDTFRHFDNRPDMYSWWSMRTFARERNVGWRIDYFFVSPELKDNLKDAKILMEVEGSDHCPVLLELEF